MIITATCRPPCPCRVYDANGLEWKYLRSVDTESGEAEQMQVTEDGDQRTYELTPDGKSVATKMVRLATPVLFVPIR